MTTQLKAKDELVVVSTATFEGQFIATIKNKTSGIIFNVNWNLETK